MARLRVVTWNGSDLPPELRELPMGHYVVQPIEIVHELDDDDIELEGDAPAGVSRTRAGTGERCDTIRAGCPALR
jgi:hypothetical protein